MLLNHGEIIISTKIKNKLRTIEAQIVRKLKNSQARSKFTGSEKSVYFMKKCNRIFLHFISRFWRVELTWRRLLLVYLLACGRRLCWKA